MAAAPALKAAFTAYARGFPGAAVRFTGVDALRRSPRPDVVAAPSGKLPSPYSAGLVEKPAGRAGAPAAARAFVAGPRRPAGRHALSAAGFATAPFRPR